MDNNEAILTRLNRIEGQIRGVARMIEDQRDCRAVLQQIAAARSALYNAGLLYLENNMIEVLEDENNNIEENKKEINKYLKYLSRL